MSSKQNPIDDTKVITQSLHDEWSIHEQLCLATTVTSLVDKDWASVSQALEEIVNSTLRPKDWFKSNSCEKQLGKLLGLDVTLKRNKRPSAKCGLTSDISLTSVEYLVQKLTRDRIIELEEEIEKEQQQYAIELEAIHLLQSGSLGEARILAMWSQMTEEKVQADCEERQYIQWLNERNEKFEIQQLCEPYHGLFKSLEFLKTEISLFGNKGGEKQQVDTKYLITATKRNFTSFSPPTTDLTVNDARLPIIASTHHDFSALGPMAQSVLALLTVLDVDEKPKEKGGANNSVVGQTKHSNFKLTNCQDHTLWKARWEDCYKDLQRVKDYSKIVVDNKVVLNEFGKCVMLRPMNMNIIQKNIENHISTTPDDVKRDFNVMCNNILTCNKNGIKFRGLVDQFIKNGVAIIDKHLEVDEVYKSYRKQIRKMN